MKKSFLCFLLLLSPVAFAISEPLNQIQKNNVEQARYFAFKNLPKRISTSDYPSSDPDFKFSMEARKKPRFCFSDRLIIFFENGYEVHLFNSKYGFWYATDGKTLNIIRNTKPYLSNSKDPSGYPVVHSSYSYPKGELKLVNFSPTFLESYYFKPDGTYYAHCLGTSCYAPDGSPEGTRILSKDCSNETQVNSTEP